jgi:DNA-binding response OmpR family regulator
MARILVVDNEPLICETISYLFKDAGEEVECAIAAPSASMLLLRDRFDLAIIDATLPRASGFFLAALAADENIPVLLMSGHPDAQFELQRFGYPCIEKPFPPLILQQKAARIMRESQENICLVKTCARMRAVTEAIGAAAADTRWLAEKLTVGPKHLPPAGASDQ